MSKHIQKRFQDGLCSDAFQRESHPGNLKKFGFIALLCMSKNREENLNLPFIQVTGSSAFSPSTQVDVSSKLGLDGEALILLFPLEVRRQLNSMPATLMGRSRMIYDIDGYVKKAIKKSHIKRKTHAFYLHFNLSRIASKNSCVFTNISLFLAHVVWLNYSGLLQKVGK